MESIRFDTFVRVLAARRPRRGALPFLALLGLGLVDPDDAGAAKSGKCRRKPSACETCKKGKCERKHGEKTCKRGKIKPKANGTVCRGGTCQSGSCIGPTGLVVGPTSPTGPADPSGPGDAPTTCAIGQTLCGSQCVNGPCCPGTACAAPGCECRLSTEGESFCINTNIQLLCAQCPATGCQSDFVCVPATCAGVTAVCRPVCVT
jgi:hypothetical protein